MPGRAVRGLSALALLAALGLGAAVLGAGGATVAGGSTVAAPVTPLVLTSPPPAPALPEPVLAPLRADAPAPDPVVLAAVLGPLAADPGLGTFTGQVRDAATGEVLWARGADVPQVPASTTKVLTAAAAMLTLDPDVTLPTTVVDTGAAAGVPGQVTLVGAGDPTLSGQPAGEATTYPGAARLADLVAQVQASGVAPTSVVVDLSAYTGPVMAEGWSVADIGGGYIAPAEPAMLDGARSDPLALDPPRSPTPGLDAGRALAQRLGLDPAGVTVAATPAVGTELARVTSAPLAQRLATMLLTSDNVLAEAVGREVAVARGEPASFTGATAAVRAALAEAGWDVTGFVSADTGGLSSANQVPAQLLGEVLAATAGPGEQAQVLRPLLDWLPVAGATGTLAERYGPGGSGTATTQGGAGWVRAKTGTLSAANALAGVLTDADGRVLTFALMSTGASPGGSRVLLDAMAGLLRSCGCR